MDGVNGSPDLADQLAHRLGPPAPWPSPTTAWLQAFPDAMNAEASAPEGASFKILYGLEAYFVNDMVRAVGWDGGSAFDGEFVVVRPRRPPACRPVSDADHRDRRREGAGAGRLSTSSTPLSTPSRPIPAKITELDRHHRRDGGGCAARKAEALRQFCDFCGDSKAVLVAHNAPFDTSFVKARPPRGMSIDVSLHLHRHRHPSAGRCIPSLKNHKLDTVAEHLKLARVPAPPRLRRCPGAGQISSSA